MNPVLGIIGNMLGGSGANSGVNVAGNHTQNQNGNSLMGILSLYGKLKNSSNPMGALQSMAAYNPQVKQAMDIVNQNGGDMRSAFYKLAEQNGINPDEILGMIK